MSQDEKHRQANTKRAAGFGAAMAGATSALPKAAATDAITRQMDELRKVGRQYANLDPRQAKGFLFEHILAGKFNADAAEKGLSVRAHVMAAQGDPHAAADIVLMDKGEIVQRIQAKASDSSTALTRYLKDDKYSEMTKAVPSDKADTVREYAEKLAERKAQQGDPTAAGHADTARNVTGEVKHDGAGSGSTSHKEIMEAANNPSGYAFQTELRYVAGEAVVAGASAAAAGAVMTGALSGIKNVMAVANGEKTAGEATLDTLKDAGGAGVKSGLAGAGGAVIRYGAGKAGMHALTKSNVATAAASALVEAGCTVLAFAKGEISGEEAALRLGETGCSTMGGIYVGAAAGLVFGPVGAVVGSIVGYTLSAHVYQACVAVFKSAALAKEEAERVIALSEAACNKMREERAAFEQLVEQRLSARRDEFMLGFSAIDAGMQNDDHDRAIEGLAEIAELFGKKLRYANFSEFDAMMLEEDTLVL